MKRIPINLIVVAMVTLIGTASVIRVDTASVQDWNIWPEIRLPKLTLEILTKSAEDKSDVSQEASRTNTKQDIDSERRSELDLRVIEHGLSFQKASAKNLSKVQRTQIKIKESDVPLNLTALQAGNRVHNSVDTKDPTNHFVDSKSRRRRHIFGPDNRYKITDEFRETFPFSAVVQLSTGCSGMLIGPRHVLTAAECIHTGKRYRGNAMNLRVGLIRTENATTPTEHSLNSLDDQNEVWKKDKGSLIWYNVDQIYLPDAWVSPGFMEKREHSNYAVLQLTENHKHNCMEVGMSSITNTDYRQRIHFSSFEDYQYHPDPALSYRYCYIVGDTNNYLYEQCDATRSSVGAGVYRRMWDAEEWQWSRRVMAIKTSDTSRIRVRGKREKVHRDVRITVLNFAQICYWVMGNFEVCSRGRIEDACLMA